MALKSYTYKALVFLAIFVSGLWISCAKEIKYEDIGKNVAGPTGVAQFDGLYFYVLNSDFDQQYNTGSILVLGHDGNKVTAVEAPRLGTNLLVAGNDLLAAFSADVEGESTLKIYDLTDPANPALQKSFELDCQPTNIAAVANGSMAAMCSNGDLYVGELRTPRSDSILKKVREYGYSRRALHIDAARGILFAFPTFEGGNERHKDERLTDEETVTDDGSTNVANEIPDVMESNANQRANLDRRQRFQFIVYDLTAEKAANYPLKENADVQTEFRWTYFHLKGRDNVFDYPKDDIITTSKLYRTNFWATAVHLTDPNVFYMSHRNPYATDIKRGNDVLKVTVSGDPRAVGDVVPKLDTYLQFVRVYGFKEEQPARPFPASIVVQSIGSREVILVNHFNNLNVTKEEAKFSLAQKLINGTHKRYELQGQPPDISYYEMAVMPDGRTLAGSFFGHMVLLFDVDPFTNITEAKITKIK